MSRRHMEGIRCTCEDRRSLNPSGLHKGKEGEDYRGPAFSGVGNKEGGFLSSLQEDLLEEIQGSFVACLTKPEHRLLAHLSF